MVGEYRDHRFMPEVEHKLDYGDRHFYAPQSFHDGQGRRIIFGWVHEGRSIEAAAGKRLVRRDVVAARPVAWARTDTCACSRCPSSRTFAASTPAEAHSPCLAGQDVVLPDVAGDTLELLVELAPASTSLSRHLRHRGPALA